MGSKKTSDEKLKDKLWEMVQTVDLEEGFLGDLADHPDFEKWAQAMVKRPSPLVNLPPISLTKSDALKLLTACKDGQVDISDKALLMLERSLNNSIRSTRSE